MDKELVEIFAQKTAELEEVLKDLKKLSDSTNEKFFKDER